MFEFNQYGGHPISI